MNNKDPETSYPWQTHFRIPFFNTASRHSKASQDFFAFHFALTQNETKKSRLQFLTLKIFPFAKFGGRVPAGHFPTH